MTTRNIFVTIILLFSVVGTKAADDETWRREIERKMDEVLQIVQKQEKMVRQRDSVIEGQNQELQRHSKEIDTLKRIIDDMNLNCKSGKVVQQTERRENRAVKEINNEIQISQEGLSKRLLLPLSQSDSAVAFYAYISKNFGHVGNGHVYIFDTVVTNHGNAYNNHSGAFTAPIQGLYAFSWTIFAAGEHLDGESGQYGEVSVHLQQNGKYRGSIYVDTEQQYEEEMATGFAILSLNAGDVVMIVSPSSGQGSYKSDWSGRWSFSGFRMA